MARHDAAHHQKLREGIARAQAAGVSFGRRPAAPEVAALVLAERAAGMGWGQIVKKLNARMETQGGPRPPQGAARWCRSSVRGIHSRAVRVMAQSQDSPGRTAP